MGLIKNKIFVFIILILLQSCSGGRIGNFLESSFKNIEEPKTKEDIKKNLKNKIVINTMENVEKNKNIEEPKTKEGTKKNLKNKIVINSGENEEKKTIKKPEINENIKNNVILKSDEKLKKSKRNAEKIKSFQKKQFKPQSYKIIFILKEVDPKDPTENLRNILRNSDVNFEIEKIERFFDLKDKGNKRN